MTNVLYYGDNLQILRDYIADESVDLVYLDPPWNSNRNFNVIFKDQAGRQSDGQLRAFEDTWDWGDTPALHYAELTNSDRHGGRVPETVSTLISALRTALGATPLFAYLVEMTVRLVELRRVLRPTGSLYLHCDPTASHYLKTLLDALFGPRNFRNEIVWKRSDAHNDATQGARRYGRIHDVLLFYTRSEDYTFNTEWLPLSKETADKWYRHVDEDGRRYNLADLSAAKPGGDTLYEFHGVRPPPGRYWAYSRDKMEDLWRQGRIVITRTGKAYRKRYLEESKGTPVQDLWLDIDMLRGFSPTNERLGYPTQKPRALLERITRVSSNPGDLVLDPFCGCGTAVVAAHSLGRRWIGIDVTYLAIGVMKARLRDQFGLSQVRVIREPTELGGLRELALSDDGRYQFQWWAVDRVGGTPVGSVAKKGADRGIDGVITFTEQDGALGRAIISVKSGHVGPNDVRALRGALEREGAAIGILISLDEPTAEMRREAASAGHYHSALAQRDYPRLQLLSGRDLMDGRREPQVPVLRRPSYSRAPRLAVPSGEQMPLPNPADVDLERFLRERAERDGGPPRSAPAHQVDERSVAAGRTPRRRRSA